MTEKELNLLSRDLAGRVLYDVVGTVPITFVDYKNYDMDGFYWDYEEEVDVTLASMTSDGVIYVHAVEPELYDHVSYEQEAVEFTIEQFKPYLRRVSDLTEQETEELASICGLEPDRLKNGEIPDGLSIENASGLINFFNVHHVDYNHLIERGLAYLDDKTKSHYK